MLESKRLQRAMAPGEEIKGRRQTDFIAWAGQNGPGEWTQWQVVHSYTRPMEILVLPSYTPVVAGTVLIGEINYTDQGGLQRTFKVLPDQSFRLKVGVPNGSVYAGVKMRFKNNSKFSFGYPGNRIDVKVIIGFPK